MNPIGDPPAGVADAYAVNEDSVLNVSAPGVLANDTDPDAGTTLTAVLVTSPPPAAGSLQFNANGSLTFTPTLNFNGTTSFTYRASDGVLTSAITTVTLTVNPVNDSPLATSDAYSVNEDTTLTINVPGVLANDSDSDAGTTLAAVLVAAPPPAEGSLSLAANGSFVFTPALNFNGTTSFTYRASDGSMTSDITTVTITVNPIGDPPAGVADAYAVNEDSVLNVSAPGVLANDTDPDAGTTLSALVVSPPSASAGTLQLNSNGSFTFVPALNFNGTASFTYLALDGVSATAVTTVTLTVNPVNDAPVFASNPITLNATEDAAFTGQLSASDVDAGAVLSFTKLSGPSWLVVSASGALSGIPANGDVGLNSFAVQVGDAGSPGLGGGSAASVSATLDITVANTNDAPVFASDPIALTAIEDTAFSGQLSASDADAGAVLSFTKLSGPSWLAVSGSGALSGTPANPDVGPNTFSVQVSDAGSPGLGGGSSASVTATLTITVANTNDAPAALPDTYTLAEDSPLAVAAPGVLGNDSDPDTGAVLSAVLVTPPPVTEGTLVLNPNGSFGFTPAPNFNGTTSFAYRATDGEFASGDTTVTLNITPVNDAPTALNDVFEGVEDTPVVVSLPGILANDSDVEGSVLTAQLEYFPPQNGTLVLNANGSLTYTPNRNFFGTVSFTYRAKDGSLTSNVGTVTINVAPVNDAPVGQGNVYTTTEGSVLSVPAGFGVLWNDSDVEGDPLSSLLVAPPPVEEGVVALNSDGSFAFTPAPGFSGLSSFTYAAFDGALASSPVTVILVVNADSDGDGLDDAWELSNFGGLGTGPMDDTDGDGQSNLDELMFRTSPTTSDSNLKAQFENQGVGITLVFKSSSGRLYRIQKATEPGSSATWSDLPGPPLVGDGSIKLIALPQPTGAVYYRISVNR